MKEHARIRSLAGRLSLAFIAVVIVTTSVVGLVSGLSTQGLIARYIQTQRSARLGQWAASLAGYYAARGSWDGVQTMMSTPGWGPGHMMMGGGGAGAGQPPGDAGPGSGTGMGMGLGRRGWWWSGVTAGTETLYLADSSGRVVGSTDGSRLGDPLSPAELSSGYGIASGGRTVGTLVQSGGAAGLAPLDLNFSRSALRVTIIGAALSALAAGLIAAWLARRMTRPLVALAAGAHRLAAGDLDHRVPKAGGDEIGGLARAFNTLAESLQRNEEQRRNMVADIAHELRTPLAILRSQLETVQEGRSELGPAALMSLIDEVLRMSRLVNDLQELTQAEAGQLGLRKERLQPGALVRAVVGVVEPEAQRRGIRLDVREGDGVPIVEADPDRLRQVLLNLLTNAFRHSGDGGRVSIEMSRDGDWATVAVADTGPGIAPEDLPHLFDRFYRGDKSRTRTGGGVGLGLAIVKGFVEAHGGRVGAENVRGGGARFWFSLPGGPPQVTA
ncbi:MAG TPA: ATP-binding protein [Bacillota bacterium]